MCVPVLNLAQLPPYCLAASLSLERTAIHPPVDGGPIGDLDTPQWRHTQAVSRSTQERWSGNGRSVKDVCMGVYGVCVYNIINNDNSFFGVQDGMTDTLGLSNGTR